MKTGEVNSGLGRQSDQPGGKIQWLKQDMGGAIGIGSVPVEAPE